MKTVSADDPGRVAALRAMEARQRAAEVLARSTRLAAGDPCNAVSAARADTAAHESARRAAAAAAALRTARARLSVRVLSALVDAAVAPTTTRRRSGGADPDALRRHLMHLLEHEMRTPLTRLLAQAQWLQTCDPNLSEAERARALRVIVVSACDLAGLLAQLADALRPPGDCDLPGELPAGSQPETGRPDA